MANLPEGAQQPIGTKPQWVLVALVLVVMIIGSLAFFQPTAQGTSTPAATITSVPAQGEVLSSTTPTPADEPVRPAPTQEEIGYTDGIIFCSSVLVLILLVGTLRETIRYRRRQEGEDGSTRSSE